MPYCDQGESSSDWNRPRLVPAFSISAGDGVAVGPNGKELIVDLVEKGGGRLVRIPLSGEPVHDIPVQSDLPIGPLPLSGNCVRKDGKIFVGVVRRDSWFFSAAILDPASGELSRVPLNYVGDLLLSGWGSDSRILAMGELRKLVIPSGKARCSVSHTGSRLFSSDLAFQQ